LTHRLDASRVSVSALSIPKAGFSNETIIGNAEWTAPEGDHALEFVLRIQPTAHQLFLQPDALRQARVMEALAPHVPVPAVLLSEDDDRVLGAPFFLMRRVHGRIPSDVPSWHQRGWTTELGAEQQRRLHDNALTQLVRLHRIDTDPSEFGFLESNGSGTALERYVEHLATWHDWCRPVIRYGVDVIDAALEYVTSNVPDDPRRSVMWGDARVGNIIFDDDLAVAAMLDWEGASLAPPELDVAWWVMFDEFLCESQGLTRLPGVHDRPATFERYAELAGEPLRNIGYYEVLVGLQFSLINSRLADLLITTGRAPEALASSFVTRVTAITRRALDNLG
jgi:aminoglycoside phosphotransferase (APT) family kinase protein